MFPHSSIYCFGSLFMSLMTRVSQRTREGHHGSENRGIFLGAPRLVEGHRRHIPPWPSIISYPVYVYGTYLFLCLESVGIFAL